MATRLQLRERIRAQMDDLQLTHYTNTDIDNWIQDCHDEMARDTKYYKRWATTNLAGGTNAQHELDLTTLYIVEVDQVAILPDEETTYKLLRVMPWHVYRRYSQSQETTGDYGLTGTPTHYCWYGDSLYLYPACNYDEDDGVKIWFSGCQSFSADTDESTLPRQFQDTVIWYGVWRARSRAKDPNLAEYYRRLFEQGKAKLREWAASTRTIGPDRIPRWDEVRTGGMDSRL